MNESVEQTISQLIEAAKTGARASGARISKTQQVRQHLDQIEEALENGVGRAALAQAYGWSISIFDAALYRARRMRQAGGDRRIHQSNQPPAPAPAGANTTKRTTSAAASPEQTNTNSLRKPL